MGILGSKRGKQTRQSAVVWRAEVLEDQKGLALLFGRGDRPSQIGRGNWGPGCVYRQREQVSGTSGGKRPSRGREATKDGEAERRERGVTQQEASCTWFLLGATVRSVVYGLSASTVRGPQQRHQISRERAREERARLEKKIAHKCATLRPL